MESQEHYNKWIKNIANDYRVSKEDIIEHIQKHSYEEITSIEEWIASFENLLEILKVMTNNEGNNLAIKVERLNSKYLSDPNKYTEPPY